MCVVDCTISPRKQNVQIDGVCYRDAAGTFWHATYVNQVGRDAEAVSEITARHIANRQGFAFDGRVVRVRFVEVEG
jgi:hypothetical protein